MTTTPRNQRASPRGRLVWGCVVKAPDPEVGSSKAATNQSCDRRGLPPSFVGLGCVRRGSALVRSQILEGKRGEGEGKRAVFGTNSASAFSVVPGPLSLHVWSRVPLPATLVGRAGWRPRSDGRERQHPGTPCIRREPGPLVCWGALAGAGLCLPQPRMPSLRCPWGFPRYRALLPAQHPPRGRRFLSGLDSTARFALHALTLVTLTLTHLVVRCALKCSFPGHPFLIID